MTATLIPVLAAMYLGSSFNIKTHQKGNADIFDHTDLEGNINVSMSWIFPAFFKIDGDSKVIDRSFTKSQYKLVETALQARTFLDVSGDLSLKIKKGDVHIGGAGDYLKETANRQKFVELLVRVQHETVTETIPSHLKPKTDWMSMSPRQVGTHFVRSITYGGELIASLRLKASTSEEREIIKAAVTSNLQLSGTFDLNANGSFDKLRKDLKGMYNEDIKVSATKMPTSPPQTVEDLMKLVDDYPKEIQSINNGKGKALKAELYPLSSFKGDYPLYMDNRALNNLLDDVETKYDDIRLTSSELRIWNRHLDITEEQEEQVEELFGMIQAAQSAFHKAIADMDVSSEGLPSQFDKAFAAYGTGKENLPNRFQRLFWKLRKDITGEQVVWDKPLGSGAIFITWGSSDCGSNTDTEMLINGYAAATSSSSWNGGKNFLCLPTKKPAISEVLSPPSPRTPTIQTVFQRSVTKPENHTTIIPCATCIAIGKIDVETFPAMKECPEGWTEEYSGYLRAESISSISRDFLCVKPAEENAYYEGAIKPGKGVPNLNLVFMNCETCREEKSIPCVVCTK